MPQLSGVRSPLATGSMLRSSCLVPNGCWCSVLKPQPCLQPLSSPRLLTALLFLSFALPVSAVDDDLYALAHAPIRQHRSTITAFVLLAYAVLLTRKALGPSMGISSILWVMMRNDPAISPKLSWMVFGTWSFLMLTYLFVQCHRVFNHQLYMLLTMATASVGLCVIALIQKSSLPGGLVTVIPPCTSFGAYAMAYFFPDRFIEGSGAIV
ncbi:hypothetical protein BDV96DRAFT_205793 [Lophiotrema nucula]|uniref:Uncharacterized protein n=1 Tax=Lophiotrema nucula TaxID=690887 RepID=A0A6A5ZPW2_9PLEO|nr:hypothetical protein BDV96DRAFT_205793 [Lophiotrema nucula]